LTLYSWQTAIILTIIHVVEEEEKSIITNLPTGHGKSLLIANLGYYFAKKDWIVVVVTMNEFLCQAQFRGFSYPAVSKISGSEKNK
jgi:superfamily II DNA or RNA helicase